MPRRPRIVLSGVPLHVIQRGNNRTACFYAEDDYRFYLEWLKKNNNRGQTTVLTLCYLRLFLEQPMPRRPRIVLPGVPLHVIQRGNNRTACFYAEDDYRFYLEWLEKYAADHDCRIHAYVLMTNHVHLLLSFERGDAPGALMKALGQRYVQYVNRTYRRSGTLWEGRFRSALIQAEPYLLLCQRYIELNPVRARMVEHPADYPWSSYQCNALGVENPLVSPHALYCSLGGEAKERLSAYRELFRFELEPGAVDQLRAVTNGNFALGDEQFSAQVAEVLGRRVTPGLSGRPRRKAEIDDGFALS